MKVAYFINQYPKVSHSFIRREIEALERLGFCIDRYALKTDVEELVDDKDRRELGKTRYLLQQPYWIFIQVCFIRLLKSPLRFFKTLIAAMRMGWNSDRGLLRHLVYFVEACLLSEWLCNSQALHVHAHFGTNSATVVMLAHMLGGPPYSFTVHGPEEFDKPEFISLGVKISRAEFVVAISSFGKSQLFRWIGHDQWDKVKVVHCGLEKAFYDIDIQPVRQTGRIVCVGRLCEQKGQLLLVEAAIKLAQEGEEFQLILAGDGPMRAEIEALIKMHDMASRISITGWVSSDRIRQELLDSMALVLPSFAEGLPVVLMESMALGRPVISTYIAGIPELVIPDKNGWLIPAGSLETLVTAMRKALHASNEDLQTMGAYSRQWVIQRHDINTEAKKLALLFGASKLRY